MDAHLVQLIKEKKTWDQIEPQFPGRAVKDRWRKLQEKYPDVSYTNSCHWTAEEDARLVQLIKEGYHWDIIEPLFPQRNPKQRWYRNLQKQHPDVQYTYDPFFWTPDEDAKLVELVKAGKYWSEIKPHFPKRETTKRWYYVLQHKHPDVIYVQKVMHKFWTPEEDARLVELIKARKSWSEIKQHFPGRAPEPRWMNFLRGKHPDINYAFGGNGCICLSPEEKADWSCKDCGIGDYYTNHRARERCGSCYARHMRQRGYEAGTSASSQNFEKIMKEKLEELDRELERQNMSGFGIVQECDEDEAGSSASSQNLKKLMKEKLNELNRELELQKMSGLEIIEESDEDSEYDAPSVNSYGSEFPSDPEGDGPFNECLIETCSEYAATKKHGLCTRHKYCVDSMVHTHWNKQQAILFIERSERTMANTRSLQCTLDGRWLILSLRNDFGTVNLNGNRLLLGCLNQLLDFRGLSLTLQLFDAFGFAFLSSGLRLLLSLSTVCQIVV
eukprot:COSAG05_NODE_51_length_23916_cov_18.924931_16_plen_500_part_00